MSDEEFHGGDFGFGDDEFDDQEEDALVAAPDEQALAGQNDDEAFGDFSGFEAAIRSEETSQPAQREVKQTILSQRYARLCQAFEGPQSGESLASIAFGGVHMLEEGTFTIAIRDEDDDYGKTFATLEGLDASSSTSAPKTISLPTPVALIPGQRYYIVIRYNSGKFKFEVDDLSSDRPTGCQRYKFCLSLTGDQWVRSSKDHALLLATTFQKEVNSDPERGELSNWVDHIKTSLKKGTIARRLSIRKRHAAHFFVLEQFQIRYYKEVDGELLGTISLRDAKRLHEPMGDGSTVIILEMKSSEHTIRCRSQTQCSTWCKALASKLEQIQAVLSGNDMGVTMDSKPKIAHGMEDL
eukprot:TRINITY_DN10485_c0_g2_i4.p1 TRINITY_DN10485_c0_g2~~TRINITY_DN10485_c0_g2_i4.p1  ORF type:complete len:364 (+),score=71.62 TRINITY_DN10485_c0_g2_i4:33-1094(+)